MAFETNFKPPEHSVYSPLSKFYETIGRGGVLIKSNYECHFEYFLDDGLSEQLTFYC